MLVGDAQTDASWTMNGLPISWSASWAELAWRFKRPHRPPSERQTEQSSSGEGRAAAPAAALSRCRAQLPLELENGVTTRHNKRLDRSHAEADVKRQKAAASLNMHVEHVKKNSLVFVDVSSMESAEGEMAIGLARALEDCNSGNLKLKWYVRKEWSTDKKHKWSTSPTFMVAGDPDQPRSAYVTQEPISNVLPLEVALTSKSTDTKPRLTAECVRMAREVCKQRGLIREPLESSTRIAQQKKKPQRQAAVPYSGMDDVVRDVDDSSEAVSSSSSESQEDSDSSSSSVA